MKPLESVTAALPEAMRNLELPQLPSPSTENAALLFGDWLTVISPLMGDLSTSSREFWDWAQREVEVKYNEWLLATPLGRLRIKVEEQVSPRFQRLDQRASSTLLAALPEPVRKDIVASRRVATQAILYKLFTIYQPGGNAERGNLLRSLTEVKCGSSIQDTLGAIRTWRRWICRAEELHVAIPDSMVLIQALSKVAENLTKHGGSQVGFRIAAARQELEVDRRPTLTTTKEFAEFLQAEAEDLALTMPHPSSAKTTSSGAVLQPVAGAQPTIKALGGGAGSRSGKVKGVVGGPPCRTTSRLRCRGPPGPRRVRGRGADRWGLEGLTAREREQVRGDSALVVKQVGLWHLAEEHREGSDPVAFLLESPQDPASYVGDGVETGHDHPSFFEWPLLRRMVTRWREGYRKG